MNMLKLFSGRQENNIKMKQVYSNYEHQIIKNLTLCLHFRIFLPAKL